VFVHPSELFVLLSSHYSVPTMNPSIFLGEQTSFVVLVPPEQIQVERTDKQSGAHPSPSVIFPSSQASGVIHIELPHISQ